MQPDYFAAYRNLKLSRDEKGVLVAEFHSNGGAFIMTAQSHTEFVDAFHRIGQDRANRTARQWHARELADLYLKAPEVTRRNTRIHFIQPLKERVVREVGYGLSLEGASSAALVKSKQSKK